MKTEIPMWKMCRAMDGLRYFMVRFDFEGWSGDEMIDFIDAYGGVL